MGIHLAATRKPAGPSEWRVAVAGVLIVGVSYGFARYGYGLFLPRISAAYDLSTSTVGLIASATYVGYLMSLTLVGLLATRLGPRPLVVCAGLSAAIGMALVAVAPSTEVLVAGLVLAGTSSGWAWAPYSDAVDRLVTPSRRQPVMALAPTGTAFGVAVAGPLALLTPDSAWRSVWMFFSLAALVTTVVNARTLPPGPNRSATPDACDRVGLAWFARAEAAPLYVTALSYGLVGAVYWTFAVDAISRGDPDVSAAPLFWTLIGLAGTAGVLTGPVLSRLGLRRTHTLIFLAIGLAVALLGLAPHAPIGIAVSALLYGPTFMAGSGLLAVWSYRLFRDRPATGFSATVFFLGVGTIVGPAAVGLVADRHGLGTAFLLAAAVAATTLPARPQLSSRSKNATDRRIDRAQFE
jgi:predicted MFS family arabinose efflux permease